MTLSKRCVEDLPDEDACSERDEIATLRKTGRTAFLVGARMDANDMPGM